MERFISDPSSDDDPSEAVRLPRFRDEIRVSIGTGGVGDWRLPRALRDADVE